MEKIKTYVKLHPRRAMAFGGLIVLVLIVFYVVAMLLLNAANKSYVVNNGITPVSYINLVSYPTPVSSAIVPIEPPMSNNQPVPPSGPQLNPSSSGYVSAPVTMVSCNGSEETLIDAYYSLCYPTGYTITKGTRSITESDTYNAIYMDSNSVPFVIQRIDGLYALNTLPYLTPNPYPIGYKDIDTLGLGMMDYDKKLMATNIGTRQIGKFRGLDVTYFTLEQPTINTFTEQISLPIPVQNTPSKVMIFIQGNSNFILIYEENSINQRIIDSLVFNQ